MCLVIEGEDPAVDAAMDRIEGLNRFKADLERFRNETRIKAAYFDEVFNTLESHARWFQDFVKGNPEHEVRARELLRIVERNRV